MFNSSPSKCFWNENLALAADGPSSEMKPIRIMTIVFSWYLRIAEYTSHRIPPVQYINISVFSLSAWAKGSEAMS